MHALRMFVQAQMDERGWTQSDLVAASGITKQVVSSLVSDARPKLDRLPQDKTIDGLARAFRVDRNVILAKIGEAMGLPVSEPVVIYDASRVPNSDLLRVLSERLSKAGEEHEHRSAPMNPAGESPAPGGDSGSPKSAWRPGTTDWKEVRASMNRRRDEALAAEAPGDAPDGDVGTMAPRGALPPFLVPIEEFAARERQRRADALTVEQWAARKGTPGGGPDLSSGEESQDSGSDEPA